jgi:sugar lactone lactonase YvrE
MTSSDMISFTFVHLFLVIPDITPNARWTQNGVTVAGSHDKGNATNQLDWPQGLFVDDDNQIIIIADFLNNRIVQWKMGDTNGQVVAGGRDAGNRLDQLNHPIDVLLDKQTNSLIICDHWNFRVVQWSRCNGTTQGEILLDNIYCWGLAIDDQRNLYISDYRENEVRRYQMGHKNGTLVAGGYGNGAGLNQLNEPHYIFVDHQQTVYVSDRNNHRVMKWNKGAIEGTVIAGGQGEGNALTQLHRPNGLFVDTLGTLYVADYLNHRVMRWTKGATQGTVIAGGNDRGQGTNQLNRPLGLSFDRHGNIYVVDSMNHRIQQFLIQ